MLIIQTITTGYIGGPGYTDFHFEGGAGQFPTQQEVDGSFAKVIALWAQVKAFMPAGWVANVQNVNIREVTASTGALLNLWTAGGQNNPQAGGGAGGHAAPAGGCMTWRTLTNGRGGRVTGRTFFVPMASVAYDTDGGITPSVITTMNSAADSFVQASAGALAPVVWSRPRLGVGGVAAPITLGTFNKKVAVLTSRRD